MSNNQIIDDLLKFILNTTTNSVEIGQFVADQLRSFVKSAWVILVVNDKDIQAGQTIVGKSPREKKLDEKLSWIYQISELSDSMNQTIIVHHDEPESEIAALLAKIGGKSSILSPLKIGANQIGLLLLIDVNHSKNSLKLVEDLDTFSGTLAIKLQNLDLNQKLEFEYNRRNSALLESEEYNRFLFDHSVTGLVLCTMDGSMVDINPAFSEIIGWSIEETLQLSFRDITPEKYREEEINQLRLLEQEGKYGPYTKEYIHKDGHLVPVVLRGASIELNGERFIWSTVEDITELKRVQNEMLESSRRFIDVLKNVNLISIIMDTNGKISFCNDYFLKLTGYESNELIGNDWFEIFLPKDISAFIEERHKTAIRENKEFDIHYENEIRLKNGERRLIAWTNNFLKDIDGNITGSASLGEDITEKKKAEENLYKSESKFRALVESTSDLIWETNLDGVYTYVSPQIQSILGYSVEETLMHSPFTHLVNQEKDELKLLSEMIIKEKKSFKSVRNRYVHKNGSFVYLETSGVPILDENGEYSGYRGISRDITDFYSGNI